MRRREDESVRITSAQRPRSEDIGGRQKRYLISMAIRTACFVLAVVSIGHWFMWVFLVGAIFLPYVAVVMANAGAQTDPDDGRLPVRPRPAGAPRPPRGPRTA